MQQVIVRIDTLNLHIDAYNKEIVKLNINIDRLTDFALESKIKENSQLALYYCDIGSGLYRTSALLVKKCRLLLARQDKIVKQDYNSDYSSILREVHDLLKRV